MRLGAPSRKSSSRSASAEAVRQLARIHRPLRRERVLDRRTILIVGHVSEPDQIPRLDAANSDPHGAQPLSPDPLKNTAPAVNEPVPSVPTVTITEGATHLSDPDVERVASAIVEMLRSSALVPAILLGTDRDRTTRRGST